MQESIILKVGGSLIYDKDLNINTSLLQKVKDWYFESKERYHKIVIVVGGGNLSRNIQKKLGDNIQAKEYMHNIAMSVTQTNAALLQGFIGDEEIFSPQKLGEAYEYLWSNEGKYLITGGLKVGWSTDMDAAVFADLLSVKNLYKLSDIDYIYTEDPRENPNASPIRSMTWDEYFKLFDISDDSLHIPNKSMPIDVVCSRFCRKKDINFFLTGGTKITSETSINNILQQGTQIHS